MRKYDKDIDEKRGGKNNKIVKKECRRERRVDVEELNKKEKEIQGK